MLETPMTYLTELPYKFITDIGLCSFSSDLSKIELDSFIFVKVLERDGIFKFLISSKSYDCGAP